MVENRISQLSDDILLLILDKIGIFQAAKITFLSKRWKNLWCSLPSLRVHLSHRRASFETLSNASELVSHFLSHRDAAVALRDFHLSVGIDSSSPPLQFPYGGYGDFPEECLLSATNHGVQSLRLSWPTCREQRLPAAFLACKTLRELELGNLRAPVRVPGRLSLPNLKTLHLETPLVFDDDRHGMEPFSGLPELEKLTLVRDCVNLSIIRDERGKDILLSKTGRTYSLDHLTNRTKGKDEERVADWTDGPVVIKSPKLRVLEIVSHFQVKEVSAPLLTSFRYKSTRPLECAKFGNATTVSLTLDTLEILQNNFLCFEQILPPFPNMKCLKVLGSRYSVRAVLQSAVDNLTRALDCEVELSPGLYYVDDPIRCAEQYFPFNIL
ncbi:F-box/LRR-repeat protein-like protein [Salvia divinorum]|uniref:F-box/LRR-repeat protein-like protein n=1 Tax=Salvia divinorum TaxID=28513 RepID=A0ABD1H6L2_SALDI